MGALSSDAFVPYLTSVGGSGLGILSPYNPPQQLATPPEGTDGTTKLLDDFFVGKTKAELAAWADSLGRWLFI